MRIPSLYALAAVSLFAATGCSHITTKVPGVLDMRSDGGLAPVDKDKKSAERSGFDAIMNGEGVKGGSDVQVVDRKYWILDLFPVLNESATEEIGAAMGSDGALRNVRIGEQYSFANFGVGFCCGGVPILNCVISPGSLGSPRDFHLWGTRIKPVPAGMPPAAEGAPPDATGAAAPAPATSTTGGY